MTQPNSQTQHSAWAEVDLDTLESNFGAIRNHISAPVTLTSPVKSDAYGHGLTEVALALLRAGTDRLAVANLKEARELRGAGISSPILCLYPIRAEEAEDAVALGVEISTGADEYDLKVLRALGEAAARVGAPSVGIHLMLDTGLGRYGADALKPERIRGVVRHLKASRGLTLLGIGTQLANSEVKDCRRTRAQIAAMNDTLEGCLGTCTSPPLEVHIANSAALANYPDVIGSSARPGLLAYGYGLASLVGTMKLHPVLSVKARFLRVRSMAAGTRIGYGVGHVLPEDTRVGLLPLGYGDGVIRNLSRGGRVLVEGRSLCVLGAVSMNAIAVDLSQRPHIQAGDIAVLIGTSGSETITLQHWAELEDTIVNDLMVRIGSHLPRTYLQRTQS